MTFRFIHTADVHLDSPLLSLALKEPKAAELIAIATRQTFAKTVDLCLDEGVDAFLISGDLYDGNLRSMKTAAFFTSEMRRLTAAGVKVFLVRGNHDAESVITKHLDLPDGVHVFSKTGEAVPFEGADVVLDTGARQRRIVHTVEQSRSGVHEELHAGPVARQQLLAGGLENGIDVERVAGLRAEPVPADQSVRARVVAGPAVKRILLEVDADRAPGIAAQGQVVGTQAEPLVVVAAGALEALSRIACGPVVVVLLAAVEKRREAPAAAVVVAIVVVREYGRSARDGGGQQKQQPGLLHGISPLDSDPDARAIIPQGSRFQFGVMCA